MTECRNRSRRPPRRPGSILAITYDGGTAPPVNPGDYEVVATVTDPNYTGSAAGTLRIGITALVRHAPHA
ncbi:MAG: MBG domain-containing protein [Lacunisphaera sp.]